MFSWFLYNNVTCEMREVHVQVLFNVLKRLDLPKYDFAVFGSGPLIVRGIIAATNDLDIICRGAAWTKVKKIGTLQYNDDYDAEIVTFHDGQMTFGNSWGIGSFDVEE